MKLKPIILYGFLFLLIPIVVYGINVSVDELRELQGNPDMTFGATVCYEYMGCTGTSTYVVGDILYSDVVNQLGSLPIGTNGQVLKISSGVPAWGTDNEGVGGGSGINWWTLSSGAIYPNTTTVDVLIGANSTTTTAKLEVIGSSYFSGSATTTDRYSVINQLSVATSSPAYEYELTVVGDIYATGNHLFQGNASTTGDSSIGGSLRLSTVSTQSISAVDQTINSNDSLIEISADADYVMTALPAIATGTAGQVLILHNIGTFDIDLQADSVLSGSSMHNEGVDSILEPNDTMTLVYLDNAGDGGSPGWVVQSHPNPTAASGGATPYDVRNTSGSTIDSLKPVYKTGFNAGQNRTTIDLADGDDPDKMPAIGVTFMSIGNNANGQIITAGEIENVDTSAFSTGDILYVDTTAGDFTTTRPSVDKIQSIGRISYAHATKGIMYVTGAGRTNDVPWNFTANDINATTTQVDILTVFDRMTMLNATVTNALEVGVCTGANIDFVNDMCVLDDVEWEGMAYGALTGEVTGNASTASALAANGANCAAGSYPLGIDDAGAIESCTDATTEINTIVNALGGTGLTCAGQSCNVDLGTAIVTGEITDDEILEVDLDVTNAPTDNYILSYDNGTAGFTWVEDQIGAGGEAFAWIDTTWGMSTSTILGFDTGFLSNASSTIIGNLRVDGNATTTGSFSAEEFLVADTPLNIANWDTAYSHSQDNTQAHSDYLLNSGSDIMSGTLTADGFTLGANELLTIGSQTLTHDGTDFNFNDNLKVTGNATSSAALHALEICIANDCKTTWPSGGGDITNVFDCSTGDCNTLTVGTSEYLTYGTGYIDANRFAGVTTIDGTEFGYLNGVSSLLQGQIDGKQATLTNSAGLLAALDDETGTGLAVFSTSPTFTTGITVPANSISAAELNEGDTFTWTGTTHSFSGVTNLTIPSVANASSEIAIDTTNDDQFIYYGDVANVITAFNEKAMTIASSTWSYAGKTDIPLWHPHRAIVITDIYCETDGGTSAAITISDGTNSTESIVCDDNGAQDDGSIANGAFIASERMELDIGTVTGAVDWLNVNITYTITAD